MLLCFSDDENFIVASIYTDSERRFAKVQESDKENAEKIQTVEETAKVDDEEPVEKDVYSTGDTAYAQYVLQPMPSCR